MAKGKIKIINNQAYKLYYSSGRCHFVGLYDRPFKAIMQGKKTIEVRTNIDQIDFDFGNCKTGDYIQFINEVSGEKISKMIKRITRYPRIEDLFDNEDISKILSSQTNRDEGVNSILKLEGYREGIKKYGVWAIEI